MMELEEKGLLGATLDSVYILKDVKESTNIRREMKGTNILIVPRRLGMQ